MPTNIDHQSLVPIALNSMYTEEQKRNEIEKQLDAYGAESFHRGKSRVQLGILYLASQKPKKLEAFIDLACTDYRDLLCAAEYPYSSRQFGRQDKEPKKYRELQLKEEMEYLAWLDTICLA